MHTEDKIQKSVCKAQSCFLGWPNFISFFGLTPLQVDSVHRGYEDTPSVLMLTLEIS